MQLKSYKIAFNLLDSDQLRQQLIFERAEHQKELKDSQAQIDELRKQNDQLRRLPSTGSNQLRREASEHLNLTSDDEDVDNLTFGRFEDYWARINENEFTSSEASLNSEPPV